MKADIDHVLIAHDRIAQRVHELAAQISADLAQDAAGDPKSGILLMPIMTGAMIFCADLMRNMPIALRMGLLTVSSYPGKSTTSQGAPTIAGANLANIQGQHVVLL